MASDGLMQYFAKIGLDATEFLNGMSKSQAGVLAFYRDVSVSLNMTIQIFDRAAQSIQRFGQMANDLRDLSYTTGISTDQLQRMQYAAILSGTSFYTVSAGVNRLTTSMEEATSGTEEYVDAFNDLGVNPTGKSADQVFEETARALVGMEDVTRRNADANAIYGKSWKELLPYMETYISQRDKIQQYKGLDPKELQDLEDAKMAYDELGNAITIKTGGVLASTQSGLKILAEAWKAGDTNLEGFFKNAGAYHDKLVAEEEEIRKKVIADNNARGASADLGPLSVKGEDSGKGMAAAVDFISDAMKEYASAIDDVADAQQKLNDINTEYTRDLQTLNPRDVQGFINLRMRHQWDLADQTATVSSKTAAVGQAAGNVGLAGMAAAGITITGPITVNGDKSFEKEIQNQRIRAGVR